MTIDPRTAYADRHGTTHVPIDLRGREEGWRDPGCYVVIVVDGMRLTTAGWFDPWTRKRKLRRRFVLDGILFEGESARKLRVFRIDEWSPPAVDG